jgi:hypothetical protein
MFHDTGTASAAEAASFTAGRYQKVVGGVYLLCEKYYLLIEGQNKWVYNAGLPTRVILASVDTGKYDNDAVDI